MEYGRIYQFLNRGLVPGVDFLEFRKLKRQMSTDDATRFKVETDMILGEISLQVEQLQPFELTGAVLSDWKIEPKTFHDRFACLVSVGNVGRPEVFKETLGCLLDEVGVCWVCRRSALHMYPYISMHIHTYHIIILAKYDIVIIYCVYILHPLIETCYLG